MNRILNGLPTGSVPTSGRDAIAHYQAPKSVVLLFPGATNRVQYPITPDQVQRAVQQRFSEWGGEARLVACLATLPDAK
jgi:hypothetical protein